LLKGRFVLVTPSSAARRLTPFMADEKNTESPFPFPEINLPELVRVDDGDTASKDKALVPFDPLQRYLAEIRRFKVLSREEEHELAVQYKEYGDLEAAYKLVTANLRLVVMIAREYQKAFKNLLDLVQEGNMGLMEAVKNFDPYRGVRFPSYAVWWIRAYMIRYIMNDWRMVKIGTTQAQRKLFFNLQKEKDKIEAEGLTAGPKLLAQRLQVKEDEVVEMEQRLASRDLSVDVPIGDDDEATLLNFLQDTKHTPEEQIAETEYRELLRDKMEQFANTLKDKELVIYRERLLNEDPVTLREIGEKYGISRERVRQIEERVKKKLKTYLKDIRDVDDASGAR
jgi:RNA polymerase sigma-32 factor